MEEGKRLPAPRWMESNLTLCARLLKPLREASKKITIEDRKGSFNGKINKRTFNIIMVTKENALPLDLENVKPAKVIKYSGKKISVRL